MTLANKITIARIACVPAFLTALLNHRFQIATILGILIVLTDALDGTIARRFKQKTPLGSLLDPMADKLLLLGTYGVLVYMELLPSWVFVVILSRDIVVVFGWLLIYLLTNSMKILPRKLGKASTAFQMIYVLFLLLGRAFLPFPPWLNSALLAGMVALTASSMLDYLVSGSRILSQQGQA